VYGYGVNMGVPAFQFPSAMAAQQQAAVAAAAAVAATGGAFPPGAEGAVAAAPTTGRKGKNAGGVTRMKKAPDAPKRFKSAFIIFSAEKHREIKAALAEEGRTEKVRALQAIRGASFCFVGSLSLTSVALSPILLFVCAAAQTTDIAKKVSEAWRQLSAAERKVWDDLAARDKARFDVEKQMYQGPWKVAANRRTPKDPSAPKRPSSAFLAFSNKRRAELKKSNPNATNADLSKMLSKTWKTCDEETRREYTEAEATLRAKYKVNIAEWRRKHAEVKLAERKERETFAMQQVEMKAAMGMDITKSDTGANASIPPGMLQFLMQQAQAAQASGGAAGGDGSAAHFNPAMLQFTPGQFPVPPATMLSQLLGTSSSFLSRFSIVSARTHGLIRPFFAISAANSQQQQQGNALGLYGQGLPDQRPAGEQPPSAQLAGFGSKTEGQEGGSDSQPPSLDQQMQGFQDPALAAAMMAGPPTQQMQEFEANAEQV
jgi:HMG (high mobility group) box